MQVLKPHYSSEEFTQRGQSLYQREVQPHLAEEDEGKFVAIDIETGAYELDPDDYIATENLLKRHPSAQIWLCRVGHRTTFRIGGYPLGRSS